MAARGLVVVAEAAGTGKLYALLPPRSLNPGASLKDDPLAENAPLWKVAQRGTLVDPADVQKWGLKMSDMVIFEPTIVEEKVSYQKIISVNDETDPEVCRTSPDFMTQFVEGVMLRHADREFAVDAAGDYEMRLMRMLAPVGPGFGIVAGPSDSGKSELLWRAARGLYVAIPDAYFIFLDVGERTQDVGVTMDMIALEGIRGGLRVEHFRGFQPFTATNNVRLAVERVHRLAEHKKKVIFLVNSIWGIVLAFGRAEGGLASKGVSVEGLETARRCLFSGSILGSDGFVCVIAASLDEGNNSRSRVVLLDVGWQNAVFVWATRDEPPDRPYPWLNMLETKSRKNDQKLGRGSARHQLHLELRRRIWERGSPRQALDYALELAHVPGTWDEAVAVWRERWANEDTEAPRRCEREARRERPAEPAASAEGIVEARDRLADEGLDLPAIGAFLAAQIARKGYPISQVEELLREVAAGERQLSELYT